MNSEPDEEAPAVPVKKTRTRKKPKEKPLDETVQESAIQAGEATALDPPKRRRKKTGDPVSENAETGVKVPSSANGGASSAQVDAATAVSLTKPKRTRRVGEPKPKRYAVGKPEREHSI